MTPASSNMSATTSGLRGVDIARDEAHVRPSPRDRKRSVLLVCRMSPRINGRARALVESLQRDYDVTVVCERPAGMEAGPVFRDATLIERALVFEGKSALHIAGAIRVLQMSLMGMLEVWRRRPSAVVCADVPYSLPGILGRAFLGCRFVFDAYEIIWGIGDGPVFAALFKWLERLTLKRCDLWLVPSKLRGDIVLEAQHLALDYLVIPNLPVIREVQSDKMRSLLFRAGVPCDRTTVLFQGSLLPRRGLPELLTAAADGRFHLIIQGEGPLRALVESKQGRNVTVLSPCPNDEAVSWLSCVTASFVFYQNDCINSASACSSKLNTSMLAGTPVVCNDLPAFREFAKEHGACVIMQNDEPSEIARCIDVLATPQYQKLKADAIRAGECLREFPRERILQNAFHQLLQPGRV
jgi:glycosyltransferase involved in cell wall biosynthesis